MNKSAHNIPQKHNKQKRTKQQKKKQRNAQHKRAQQETPRMTKHNTTRQSIHNTATYAPAKTKYSIAEKPFPTCSFFFFGFFVLSPLPLLLLPPTYPSFRLFFISLPTSLFLLHLPSYSPAPPFASYSSTPTFPLTQTSSHSTTLQKKRVGGMSAGGSFKYKA